MAASDPSADVDEIHSGSSTPSSQPATPDAPSPKPPTLCPVPAPPASTVTSSASGPLGPTQMGRRPPPGPPRASEFTSDIQAKMKALMLSRQNPARLNSPSGQPNSAGGVPPAQSPSTLSPGGGFPAGMRIPPNLSRSNAPNWSSGPTSATGAARQTGGKPVMGGLAGRRNMKAGGLKLSDALKPPAAGEQEGTNPDSGSQFTKFSNIVDTQKGTLTFKNKAVVHGSGIEFSSGSTFEISLDEVDTMDELGKGNYGTVFKVRHARPKMRRPGQGLRGNMSRQLNTSDSNKTEVNGTADGANGSSNHSTSVNGNTSSNSGGAGGVGGGGTGLIMAMKELRLELDDTKFAQIIMELDILHRCVSPFIIDFYGAFFQEGSVYICIEFMDGGSIDNLYGDGIPESVLKKITLSTVMGLKYLKDEHNIIHRDVKPTNILVNTRGQVKICDFGVSGNLVASIARTNIGCQSYMAPERISGGGMSQVGANPGGGTYSVQSDIWSLGLSIIECALGRYPYPPETYDNIFSQLSAIVDGEPPDLPADRYSETAREFVHGCLNKIPKMRPTYAALIRHPWLYSLMKPPTISEDEAAEQAAEAGADAPNATQANSDTADTEISEWVQQALERKRAGKMGKHAKPALHAAPLDAVPGAPAITEQDAAAIQAQMVPNPGTQVESPELSAANIQSLDFASGV